MNKPMERSESATPADLDETVNAGMDEASELSKDDLSGVTGGTDPIKAIILPRADY